MVYIRLIHPNVIEKELYLTAPPTLRVGGGVDEYLKEYIWIFNKKLGLTLIKKVNGVFIVFINEEIEYS